MDEYCETDSPRAYRPPARAIPRARPARRPPPGAGRAVLIAGLAVLGLGGLAVGGLVALVFLLPGKPPQPGQREFEAASERIGHSSGTVGFGNSPEASALARTLADNLRAARKTNFRWNKPTWQAVGDPDFRVHCELRPGRCAFLVYVPDLRKYEDGAKALQAEVAWAEARALILTKAAGQTTELAVALRGELVYGPVWVGRVGPKAAGEADGVTSRGAGDLAGVYPFFAPDPGDAPPAGGASGG